MKKTTIQEIVDVTMMWLGRIDFFRHRNYAAPKKLMWLKAFTVVDDQQFPSTTVGGSGQHTGLAWHGCDVFHGNTFFLSTTMDFKEFELMVIWRVSDGHMIME